MRDADQGIFFGPHKEDRSKDIRNRTKYERANLRPKPKAASKGSGASGFSLPSAVRKRSGQKRWGCGYLLSSWRMALSCGRLDYVLILGAKHSPSVPDDDGAGGKSVTHVFVILSESVRNSWKRKVKHIIPQAKRMSHPKE